MNKKICITFVAFNQGTTKIDQNIKKTIYFNFFLVYLLYQNNGNKIFSKLQRIKNYVVPLQSKLRNKQIINYIKSKNYE